MLAATVAIREPPEARGSFFADLVRASLNEATRRALEYEMDFSNYKFESEIVRRHVGAGRAQAASARTQRCTRTWTRARAAEL